MYVCLMTWNGSSGVREAIPATLHYLAKNPPRGVSCMAQNISQFCIALADSCSLGLTLRFKGCAAPVGSVEVVLPYTARNDHEDSQRDGEQR
jgi:hypothetical protein